ncbi:hypothetical protein D3C72_1408320 [compost metagenome]
MIGRDPHRALEQGDAHGIPVQPRRKPRAQRMDRPQRRRHPERHGGVGGGMAGHDQDFPPAQVDDPLATFEAHVDGRVGIQGDIAAVGQRDVAPFAHAGCVIGRQAQPSVAICGPQRGPDTAGHEGGGDQHVAPSLLAAIHRQGFIRRLARQVPHTGVGARQMNPRALMVGIRLAPVAPGALVLLGRRSGHEQHVPARRLFRHARCQRHAAGVHGHGRRLPAQVGCSCAKKHICTARTM